MKRVVSLTLAVVIAMLAPIPVRAATEAELWDQLDRCNDLREKQIEQLNLADKSRGRGDDSLYWKHVHAERRFERSLDGCMMRYDSLSRSLGHVAESPADNRVAALRTAVVHTQRASSVSRATPRTDAKHEERRAQRDASSVSLFESSQETP
jgi:hypothetical protein